MQTFETDSDNRDAVSRRRVLGLGATLLGSCGVGIGATYAAPIAVSKRAVALHNVHTGESFDGVYWRDGRYDPAAISQLSEVLRDHRANRVAHFDPRLFDILYLVQRRLNSCESYQVISAYRCAATNAAQRRMHSGVAKHSYHIQAMAVDVRLPSCSFEGLKDEALSLELGGVGSYPRSDFVHIDSGPVRSWGTGVD